MLNLMSLSRKGINDGTNSPIFNTFVVRMFYVAKYRTIQKNCTIVDPLFPSFLHHHCLQILYTTNFLRECFYILYNYIKNS